MRQVVLASRNPGKLAELQALFAPLGLELRLVSEFVDEPAEESAPTFVENALLKARHAARASGLPAIADDSGLEVDALHGRPGVHSARYAGVQGGDIPNNAKLLAELAGVPDERRGARFVCAMVYLRHADDPVPLIALRQWRGRILEASRGANGFGYDPLFFVPSENCTSAELAPEIKNRLSHRAAAAQALLAQLRDSGFGIRDS
ncbi:MAG TPA: RdgB/HAM1 family non-canonical purine NTP pyrophosphatase [Solimonas sp.]|nr:RdgB/HAM1 family non-canonical purine NTP pyrophosphatase [Solimonas sp.]